MRNGWILAGVVLAAMVGCRGGSAVDGVRTLPVDRPAMDATLPLASGAFDFYLFNLSWSPEFCATHHDAAPECAQHLGFVVHGLWPQNFDGTYPQHCGGGDGPTDTAGLRDIYPDGHLLMHEWETHGTCSGLTVGDYFQTIRRAKAQVKVPKVLVEATTQLQLPPAEILGDFVAANPEIPRESFALSCGNNWLTAVEVCLGKDLKAVACQGVRSCRANVVKVAAAE